MSVFISHSSKDDDLARHVYNRLRYNHGIPCYLDDMDAELKNVENATDIILRRLDEYTHLLAVVTVNTRDSWWVPFEIGVARRAPRFITTYTRMYSTLPAYLKQWPVLWRDTDIDLFAKWHGKDNDYHLNEGAKVMLANESFSNKQTTTELFHYGLKAALGQ
jgi:hypothetical protein